jgi:hypothetical protein
MRSVIIYDLKCKKNHKFEGWFKDRSNFEEQKISKLITCPVCGGSDVDMVPSTVAIMGKDLKEPRRGDVTEVSAMKMLQALNEYIGKNFEDVGEKFAEVALKIHHGDEERRNIKGTTTPREEETLREEGVDFVKIPVPKFDS